MKLLEIKNNLAKITYQSEEPIALGRFVAFEDEVRSYVGQIVNLKADIKANYAIAKLLFTVSEDGIIDNYDGSIPSLQAKLSAVNSTEITNLIPIEEPILFGYLAQQDTKLNVDQTFFETNPIICAEKYDNINTIVRNFSDQLVRNNEKVVVLDTDHTFAEEKTFRFKKDFKLPLDAKRIDYLLNFELNGIDAATKAIIQDVFIEVKEYINSLPEGFLPFDTFLGVVSAQYETTKMPELALLKNKLLQYQNSFAQEKEEIFALKAELQTNKLTFIDIDEEVEDFQRELIEYIHENLQDLDSYVYMFVKLTSKNTDKKLLKELIENDKVFTTIVCSHNHKYIQELKQRAQGIILFAPQTVQHDFATYNTFLSKLGSNEFIVYGKLTQDIPFIVELSDFAEDIKAEGYYIPTSGNEDTPTEEAKEDVIAEVKNTSDTLLSEQEEIPPLEDEPTNLTENEVENNNQEMDISEFDNFEITEDTPVEENSTKVETMPEEPYITDTEADTEEPTDIFDSIHTDTEDTEISEELTHDELVEKVAKDVDEIYYNKTEEISSIDEIADNEEGVLTENDLDFIEELAPIEDETPEEFPETNENTNFAKDTTEEIENPNEIAETVEEDIITEEPEFEDISTDYEVEEELPVYPTEEPSDEQEIPAFEQGDTVTHPKYGKGVIEKLIKYGNKTLCSISFEDVGRRLLDPAMSELQKI